MAEWARKANKVVVIDGCFMHCHGRITKNVVGHENMIQFDAFPMYNKDNKYKDIMLVDEIPEAERKDLARQVVDKILVSLRNETPYDWKSQSSCNAE
ncbi:MAG: putative zinc-binding protein, partial [Deltaproteobacteria bacterium]|nr:putative zinc-binding protein [Deltaproteobacteria bacterium]